MVKYINLFVPSFSWSNDLSCVTGRIVLSLEVGDQSHYCKEVVSHAGVFIQPLGDLEQGNVVFKKSRNNA